MLSQLLTLLASARITLIYLHILPLPVCVLLHMQISQANTEAALGELRLRLEAHQRMLARWEDKVDRQLEKIEGSAQSQLLLHPFLASVWLSTWLKRLQTTVSTCRPAAFLKWGFKPYAAHYAKSCLDKA